MEPKVWGGKLRGPPLLWIGRTACLSIGFYTEHRHCAEKYDTYPDVNVYIHMEGWAGYSFVQINKVILCKWQLNRIIPLQWMSYSIILLRGLWPPIFFILSRVHKGVFFLLHIQQKCNAHYRVAAINPEFFLLTFKWHSTAENHPIWLK